MSVLEKIAVLIAGIVLSIAFYNGSKKFKRNSEHSLRAAKDNPGSSSATYHKSDAANYAKTSQSLGYMSIGAIILAILIITFN